MMARRAATKVRRVRATKGIVEALLQGREAVAVLQAVVKSQLGGDPTFLAGWRAARRVVAKPGTARVIGGGDVTGLVPVPVQDASSGAPSAREVEAAA